ncbi:MAG TPA: thiol:disulfide interchange protein DsbA/DsbL [Steroidobacteraceae bacterium]|jgi:thiol:disulfide interchange protein DsbA|nr:thiol:disulfide interchange protein DsbA/DsbL [Steroidobacteraceae bacterium]
MKLTRLCALLLLALALGACSRAPAPATSSAGPAASSPPPAASATNAANGTAAASNPVSANDLTAAAKTEQEGADKDTTDSGDASLEHVAPLPQQAQLPSGQWTPGTNYTVLSPAQPTDAAPGKVQVVEIFWYGCPHCYALDPYLESWLKSKPGYVDFVRVPIMWGDVHRAHARLFYTLQALGKVDELHTQVFDEIHQNNDPLYVQGDEKATFQSQLKFAEAHGISASAFTNAYNSFGVQTNLQRADDLDRRYKIDAVPTIVIDGKYEADVGTAGSEDKLIQLINDLSASEKKVIG